MVSALTGVGLGGLIISILAGLLVTVVVVIPVVAFRHQKGFVAQNLLDTSPEFARTNAAAGKGLAVLLILVFLVPTLIVVGSSNSHSDGLLEAFNQCWQVFSEPQTYWADMAWVVGVVLIPVGVFLMFYVRVKQRPDHLARAISGTGALWPRKDK